MKVKDANAGLLTNFEVLDLLRSKGATRDPLGSFGSATESECKLSHWLTSLAHGNMVKDDHHCFLLPVRQVFDYLVQSAACNQTREIVQDLLTKSEKYSLTKAERLQVLNLRPSTEVEIHLIVEDCEERMSSATVGEFLNLVNTILPPPPEKAEAKVEDCEEDEENGEYVENGEQEE